MGLLLIIRYLIHSKYISYITPIPPLQINTYPTETLFIEFGLVEKLYSVALEPTSKFSPIMPRSRHETASKQLNQETFLRLMDELYATSEFTSTILDSGYQKSVYLNEIIVQKAATIRFTSFPSNISCLQYITSRLGSLKHIDLSESSQKLLLLFQSVKVS